MIDVEQRGLEVRPDAVCAQQLLNRTDKCVLPARCGLVAGHLLEITEHRDELWQGDRLRCSSLVRHSTAKVAPGSLDLRKPVECVDVARMHRQRTSVLAFGRCNTALGPHQLPELGL